MQPRTSGTPVHTTSQKWAALIRVVAQLWQLTREGLDRVLDVVASPSGYNRSNRYDQNFLVDFASRKMGQRWAKRA